VSVGWRAHQIPFAALALAAVLALAGCGGASNEVSAAGVSLKAPGGWHLQDNGDRGLVLAEQETDLSPPAPKGPRLTARPTGDLPEPDELVGLLRAAEGSEVVQPPAPGTVGGRKAVSILVRERRAEGPVMTGRVIVALGPGRAYAFLLEAPAARWSGSVDKLNDILATVRFDMAAPPATGTLP
jgi:hypothetical protein